MNRSRRFEFWMSGILAVVCLLLLNIVVWQLEQDPRGKFAIVDLARSVLVAEDPLAASREHHEPRRVQAGVSSTAAPKNRPYPLARAMRNRIGAKQVKRIVPLPPAAAHLQAVAPPQPKTTTLEPLGYVEKVDGRVEAIISLGEHVQVVHEGEIFEDKFRVVKISPSSVELVENSAPSAEPPLMVEVRQGVAQLAAGKPEQTTLRPVPAVVSSPGAGRQFGASLAASSSQPSVRQELGYVERADGRVEAIVAEGDLVRLAPETKSFANKFHVPVPSRASVEVANAPSPTIEPPEPFGLESQAVQTGSSDQKVSGPPLIASGIETSNMHHPPGIPGNEGELETEQFGVAEPEPLADYSGGRFETNPSQAVVPTSPAVESTPPSDRQGAQSVVRTLGYVERAGGERQAIVEVLDQVYLVHEGELFAEKYRALQVTPFSVKIVEESTEASSVPAEPKQDPKAVHLPVSR